MARRAAERRRALLCESEAAFIRIINRCNSFADMDTKGLLLSTKWESEQARSVIAAELAGQGEIKNNDHRP